MNLLMSQLSLAAITLAISCFPRINLFTILIKMASKVVHTTIIKNVTNRGYAAQVALKQKNIYELPRQEPQVTKLPSGIVVASYENNAPISRVGVLFKSGSRYETAGSSGASHLLRVAAGLATDKYTAFGIMRTIQQLGGSLEVASGREHSIYTLDINRESLVSGLDVLGSVATRPSFKPWELKGVTGRLNLELALRDSTALALDLLHHAAYRNTGLGNSIFVPAHKVGKISTETMSKFVAETQTSQRMAVVGFGVSHHDLVTYASGLGVSGGPAAVGQAVYFGGEARQENGNSLTAVTVAGQGAGLGSSDALAFAIAQYVLGVGPSVKYGVNASSKLASAAASVGDVGAVSALNVNYSDSGLFGYFIIANSLSAPKVLKAVHNTIKNIKITDADVARGKAQVKAALLMASECGAEGLQDMGLQALLTGTYVSPAAAITAIDSVTTSTVQSVVSKSMSGKLSMSAVGSLSDVPYLDQL